MTEREGANEPESARSASGSTHADALAHYRAASQRAGVAAGGAERNRACPVCRGVVPFRAAECPHCRAALPPARFEHFNYTDFEPDLEAREDLFLRRSLGLVCAAALLLAALILLRCIL